MKIRRNALRRSEFFEEVQLAVVTNSNFVKCEESGKTHNTSFSIDDNDMHRNGNDTNNFNYKYKQFILEIV